jgi:drug/metabolite transporter (DMT)-like permease
MSFSMIWPIAVIVLSNVFYNICSRETPSAVNPFASLTVTYIIGAAFSAAMYFTFSCEKNLLQEYRYLNWSSFVLGLAIVGLEAGSIYMYKAGWNVSSGQLVYSIILAICLIFVGVFVYHESINKTKIIGIMVCMVGLYLINK